MSALDRRPGGDSNLDAPLGQGAPQAAGKSTLTGGVDPAQLAAQQAAATSGGTPLPEDLRAKMEQRFRADFSKVRIHDNAKGAEAMNAPAYTVGQNIFFRAGVGVHDEKILAHELTHVLQQGGATPSAGAAKVGGRHDAAEHEADHVGEAVARGEEAPAVSTGHDASTVRRFGAGFEQDGHGSIEKDAAGGSGESKGLKEMYSGNFMRDMNQLNVPTVIDNLQKLPKDLGDPKGKAIGGKGAIEITTAVIQALAIIELGPETAKLVTKSSIGAYRPEEHIDNPMGTGAADTIVTNTDAGKVKTPGEGKKPDVKFEVGEPRHGDGTVPTKMVDKTPEDGLEKAQKALGLPVEKEVLDPSGSGKDSDRDRDLKGAAIPGQQVENQQLYKVSPGGLANHIYNSTESVKGRWLKAAQLGSSPLGRSEFGAGSHAVEDYFSHSNFVEVALNSYIAQALSFKNKNQTSKAFANKVAATSKSKQGSDVTEQRFYVDTLYDKTVPAKGGKPGERRQAVTTGSFGGKDTKVSIAHVLLPHMPQLQNALLTAVDQAFGIARDVPAGGGWAAIKAKLGGTKEGSAGATLLEGFDHAGMTAPVPDLKLKWKSFPISPGLIGDPITVSLPYGVDHISQSVSITNAFATYAGIYKSVKDMQALVHKYAEYAKKIFIPLDWLIELLDEELKKVEQMARKAIKAQVTAGLVAVVDSISGRSEQEKAKAKKEGHPVDAKDPDGEFKKDLGDSLDYLHDSVESVEQETSIETRLKSGDLSKMPQAKVEALVGPVVPVTDEVKDENGKKVIRHYYKAAPGNVLPPSHSEIAKDHGPHAEVDHHHDRDNPDHPGNEAGSSFFSLARPLAVEAMRHYDAQMQVVWKAKADKEGGDGSLFGDGKQYSFQSSQGGDSAAIHDGVMKEAKANAGAESKNAASEGRSFMQDARKEEIQKLTGVNDLLNLVDFFISHPDNSSWWKPIFDAEVAKNPEPIFQSILRRNETRENRASNDDKKK
jgi:hypothetical protein